MEEKEKKTILIIGTILAFAFLAYKIFNNSKKEPKIVRRKISNKSLTTIIEESVS